MRKMVVSRVEISRYVITNIPLSRVKQEIEDLIERYGEDAVLEMDTYSLYGDPTVEINVAYKRLETKEEEKHREKVARDRKNRIEKGEKEVYEKLKKKFG